MVDGIGGADLLAMLFQIFKVAQQNGVTVVAAEGNMSEDLSHPSQDVTSPDDTTPVVRPVTNACVVIPVEIPGVSNTYFLKAAVNAVRKHRGIPELDAMEFMAYVREKAKMPGKETLR